MFRALILVRNLESSAEGLDFGEFTINRVRLQFKELRDIFSSQDVNQDDWIFEKSYTELPVGSQGSLVGGIPKDVEDILLLLRLYKAGDISFVRQAIILPGGTISVQRPDRAMNDLNSYSRPELQFKVESDGCKSWKGFADCIRESQSWSSDWFAAARRFFLSGGAKQFEPMRDDVDRILDYATALESTLVPEKDYITRRLSRRAAAMIATNNPAETQGMIRFIKQFYEIRSRIVHGSRLGYENRVWLSENCGQVELRVRQVIMTAVRILPAGDEDRRGALAELYDPTDDDRGRSALDKFKESKTPEVRKVVAANIAELVRR